MRILQLIAANVKNAVRNYEFSYLSSRDGFGSSVFRQRQIFPNNNHSTPIIESCLANNPKMIAVNWLCSKNDSKSSAKSNENEPKAGRDSTNNGDNNDDEKNRKDMFNRLVMWSFLTYAVAAYFTTNQAQPNSSQSVSWNEFVHHMLAKGEVAEITVFNDLNVVMVTLHPGAIVKGKRVWNRIFFVSMNNVEEFEDRLRNAEKRLGVGRDSVPVKYSRSASWTKFVLPALLGLAVSYFMFRNFNIKTSFNMQSMSQVGRAKFTLVDPAKNKRQGVRFADVAGLKQAKIEVMEFVDYLKKPDRFVELGAKIPTGALLLGPPGCGKTLLAKAVATESNVPFLSMNGSEFIEMIGGLGAARVRDLFKEARKRAPCIIYIDEIDAIGKKRSYSEFANSESEQTLNQLLVEMDGMSSRGDVVILASTNRDDVLDGALLRPGRFDRHILIDLPDVDERKQIFEVHLKSIVLDNEADEYSYRMACLTPGFSGADIANVVNEAALRAATSKQKQVTGKDLEYAVEKCIGGTEKRNHAMSPQEKRVVAFHESGHALVSWMCEHTDRLLKVTIIPRTNLALGFAQYVPSDQKLFSKQELFDRMCVMMGGRVAESIVFNQITTGAQNDLQKITDLAYSQIRSFGMNDSVGLVSFDEQQLKSNQRGRKPYSKYLASLIDHEVRLLLAQVHKSTATILNENRDKLNILAESLLQYETLSSDQIEKLIGPRPFPKAKE